MNSTELTRPDPDELLASINKEEETKKRGKLKIFFGMSPGVGKTYAMLQSAQIDLSKGVDVVAGYVELHNRPETTALLQGIEVFPRKKIEYKGTVLEEMDLDAILLRHPYLVLVDELAHTNAMGCRHTKRYKDVLELLDNGINVYTTVNVQHLESRRDTIAQITGITVNETFPDEIFEMADDVELIDITPTSLLDRLAEGKIYSPQRSKEAVQNFFRKGNITALREMALRLVADRVDKQLKTYMQEKHIPGPWKTGSHLLVLVGPSKSSAKLIRYAKSLTYTMNAKLVALHVENTQMLDDAQRDQLAKNIDLARQFGAEIIITSGNDLVSTTLEVARKENVTHIIIGKSGKKSFFSSIFGREDFVHRLIKESGEIDVSVIEPGFEARQYRRKFISHVDFSSSYKEYLRVIFIVLAIMLLCFPISVQIGYLSISFILLFEVLILSIFFRLGPVLVASSLNAVLWNLFFIPPAFTLRIIKTEDFLAFSMFFIIALVTGSLTSRLRKQERLTRKRAEKTNALFHLTSQLASAENVKRILEIGREDIKKYFDIDAFFLLQDGNGKLKNKLWNGNQGSFNEAVYSIAQWVFKYSKKAGRFTDTLLSSNYTFYPLKGARIKPGVVITKQTMTFNGEAELFWDMFLIQISNALEHHYLAQLAKKADFLDESDKLYKTLFNSISHELRIPVATIMGASDTLLTHSYPDDIRKELYEEILMASKRQNRLIENLLNISRLETGKIAPRIDWCDISDVFNSVIANLKDDLKSFKLDVVVPSSMPLVRIDFGLMEQVLYNLVANSCKYSYPNTKIRLKAFYDNGNLIVQEMDRGPGFAPDLLPTVFNKFHRLGNQMTGGLGLGLSIAKGFVIALKGTITVENRQNGGARFTIKIPTDISYGNNIITEEQ